MLLYVQIKTKAGGKIMRKYEAKFIWKLYEETSKIKEENIELYLNNEKVGTAEITSSKIFYHFFENFKKRMELYYLDFLNSDSREVEIYFDNELFIGKDNEGTVTRYNQKNDYTEFVLFINKHAKPYFERIKKIKNTENDFYALNENGKISIWKKKVS
jgi:hypothetical protein